MRDSFDDFKKDVGDSFVHKKEYSEDKETMNKRIDNVSNTLNKVAWGAIGIIGVALLNWIIGGGLASVVTP